MVSYSESGQKLYQQLEELNIFSGNLTANEFSAWFDTDDRDTLEFLNWFTTCIGENNVITAQEKLCYDRATKDLVLSEDHYNKLLDEVDKEYPGIFETESNELEIRCLKEELQMRKEKQQLLEKQIVSYEKLNKHLQNKMLKTQEREGTAKYKMEEAECRCLEKGDALKRSKTKLQNQIENYGSKLLVNYCDEVTPSFLSNMYVQDHTSYVKNVGDNLRKAIDKTRQNVLDSSVRNSSRKKMCHETLSPILSVRRNKMPGVYDCTLTETSFDEQLDVMQKRLEKAYLNNINANVKRSELHGVYEYLKSFNFALQYEREDNFDALINAKEEEMFTYKADIHKAVLQIVKQQMDEQKNQALQIEFETCMKKFEFMKEVNGNMDEVLSNMFLLYMLLDQEKRDVKCMETFFHKTYHYITFDQQNQLDRTQAMLHTIKLKQDETLMEKNPLVSLAVSLINGKETSVKDLSEAVSIALTFTSEYKKMEKKVFCNDFLSFIDDALKVLQNMNTLKKHLTNGPTSEYTIIPYQVHTLFREIKAMHSHEDYMLKSYLKLKQTTEHTLGKNKWLRYRRWLWMYFLEAPGHINTFIRDIQEEIENNVYSNGK